MTSPVPPAERSGTDPFNRIENDLALLHQLDPADQLPVFSRIHTALTGALAATAGPPTPSAPAAGQARTHGGGR